MKRIYAFMENARKESMRQWRIREKYLSVHENLFISRSAKNDFTCSTLEAKVFVIKLRPYSMLKCTLPRI